MHDLRVWTLTYAPSRLNNLERIQQIHQLNQEMWYLVNVAIWKRLLIMIALWILITRFLKRKYLNERTDDTHDAQMRDFQAHL